MDIETNRSSFVEGTDPVVRRVPVVDTTPVAGQYVQQEPVLEQETVQMAQASAPTYVVAPAVNEAQTVSTVRYGSISPAAIVAGIVAVALLVIGGITVARAGIHPIDKPTDVAGFTATALLGFIELGFGVVLLIAALTRAREAILFFGIVGGVAALIAVFQPTIGNGSLAIERGFAVIVAIAMAVVVVAAVLPTIRHSSNRIERISTNHM